MADPSSGLPYAVVLAGPAHWQPPRIAAVLAKLRGVPIPDAALPARRCQGILAEDLEKAQAEECVALAKDQGLSALAVPAGLLEELAPAEPISGAALGEAKLKTVSAAGAESWLSWDELRLVAAAGFKKTTSKTVKVKEGPSAAEKVVDVGLKLSGIPFSISKKATERLMTQEETELVFYLDVVLDGPKRLRVDAQDFDFSGLGARMAYNTLSNFRTLACEVAARAPGALRSRGTSALVEGRPVNTTGYDSLADLERESRWLLTLRALGKL